MTADDARRIVDARETAERTLSNLQNMCRQPISPSDPGRAAHEARIASAGVAYITAEAELQQLMVGGRRGVRVDGPAEPPEAPAPRDPGKPS